MNAGEYMPSVLMFPLPWTFNRRPPHPPPHPAGVDTPFYIVGRANNIIVPFHPFPGPATEYMKAIFIT